MKHEFDCKFTERFWSRVDRSSNVDECWNWLGPVDKYEYARVGYQNKKLFAHRISYELAYGDFDDALNILHTCDNPRCVNPRHLFAGTVADNVRDKVRKGRQAKGDNHGKTKLSERRIKRLRELSTGGFTKSDLSLIFGISERHVQRIINGHIR